MELNVGFRALKTPSTSVRQRSAEILSRSSAAVCTAYAGGLNFSSIDLPSSRDRAAVVASKYLNKIRIRRRRKRSNPNTCDAVENSRKEMLSLLSLSIHEKLSSYYTSLCSCFRRRSLTCFSRLAVFESSVFASGTQQLWPYPLK